MGSVHELPNLEETSELFLLRLNPEERKGLFTLPLEEDDRCNFDVSEDGTLTFSEVLHFSLGGRLEAEEGVPAALDERLVAKAARMVKVEFETWDKLRLFDRLQLQLAWAQDALKHAEKDLKIAISKPFAVDASPSWDTTALILLIDTITELTGALEGLRTAVSSL